MDLTSLIEGWTWTEAAAAIQLTGQFAGLLHIPSVLLRRTDRPSAQLAWILCLLTLPWLGVTLWWLLGRRHLHRQRRRRDEAHQHVVQSIEGLTLEPPKTLLSPEQRTALLPSSKSEMFPTTAGNSVKLLVGGDEAYPEFERAINEAKHSVHLMFYIWNRDEVGTRLRDLLAKKAAEGVEVRLLYDAFGASQVSFFGFMDPIRNAGGKVAPFMPFQFERQMRVNFRNHRKVIVCDGLVGFTGGLNVGDEYCEWYDVAMRVQGPVVNQLQEVFAEDWYFATKENIVAPEYFRGTSSDGCGSVAARVLASGPDSWLSVTHIMFFVAITSARERIWITTPYFTPDKAIMMALTVAALRGVDVRLMLPGKSDVQIAQAAGRGYFSELLHSGVKIYEYEPEVLHAKTFVIDDTHCVIGSSNMDTRSFHLQFEVNVAIHDLAFVTQMANLFEEKLTKSTPIDVVRWERRSWFERLTQAAARLFAPVL